MCQPLKQGIISPGDYEAKLVSIDDRGQAKYKIIEGEYIGRFVFGPAKEFGRKTITVEHRKREGTEWNIAHES